MRSTRNASSTGNASSTSGLGARKLSKSGSGTPAARNSAREQAATAPVSVFASASRSASNEADTVAGDASSAGAHHDGCAQRAASFALRCHAASAAAARENGNAAGNGAERAAGNAVDAGVESAEEELADPVPANPTEEPADA
jgi:hypothetical protein